MWRNIARIISLKLKNASYKVASLNRQLGDDRAGGAVQVHGQAVLENPGGAGGRRLRLLQATDR